VIYYWDVANNSKKKEKMELYNFSNFPNEKISYLPPDARVPLNSLKLWKPVADSVILNDMEAADLAKKKIEHEQRIREKNRETDGESYKGIYFSQQKEGESVNWSFNGSTKINKEYIEMLKIQTKELEKSKLEEVTTLDNSTTVGEDGNSSKSRNPSVPIALSSTPSQTKNAKLSKSANNSLETNEPDNEKKLKSRNTPDQVNDSESENCIIS